MGRRRQHLARRVRAGSALVSALLLAAAAGAVDLNGHWLVENGSPSPTFVEITQVGDTVSFASDLFSPTSGTLSGPVTAVGDFTLVGSGPCTPFAYYGRLLPGENAFHGTFVTLCPSTTFFGPRFTRCTCFDGNTADGDGCDASCQTEPCFTCSGEPSVCTPTADGLACDDRRDCTSGETCAAGVCGGGSSLAPCIDMTGTWHIVETVPGFGDMGREEYDLAFIQRDGIVRAAGFLGSIEPASGAFDLLVPTGLFLGFPGAPKFLPLSGTAGDVTLTGQGVFVVGRSAFTTEVIGTRDTCGNGGLEPGEQCDDGATVGGDGCDAGCQVEPCHSCSGTPSVCGPEADGAPCSDGDACTIDACSAGSCASVPVACGACTACAPTTGACVAAPRSACRASTRASASTLRVRNASVDRSDSLSWKWPRGAATAASELGDPLGGDDYTLCLFDDSAATPSLLLTIPMPGGQLCDGEPCWTPHAPAGFVYSNPDAAPDGVLKLNVDPGDDGKSKAKLKARGSFIAPPALPLPLPLRVQLQMENGTCFETRYDAAGVIRNDPTRFKARGSE